MEDSIVRGTRFSVLKPILGTTPPWNLSSPIFSFWIPGALLSFPGAPANPAELSARRSLLFFDWGALPRTTGPRILNEGGDEQ
jgi:hypothetical protein